MDNAHVVQWLEENREDSYVLEVRRDKKLGSIFMVPKTLKENDVIYTPQAISLGPYHFLKPHLVEMESEKSQIVAQAVMVGKLPSRFFAPLQIVRNGGRLPDLQDDSFFGSVIPRCKDDYYYRDARFLQNLNEEAFAMMLFRDASFLLVFLARYVANPPQKEKGRRYQHQSPGSDDSNPFHDLKSGNGLRLDVKKDVIKLENQIPLSALNSLYDFIDHPNQCFKAFVAKVCSEYSPLWIEPKEDPDANISSEYSPLLIEPNEDPDLVSKHHLLHCLHATVYKNSNRNSKKGSHENSLPKNRKTVLPSAVELSKAGVKFRHCKGGIECIRFDRAESTLYLPQLKIGIMTETIIRNLIAFELSSSEIKENAVTGFVRMLNELTQGDKDAEVLRTNEIFLNLGVGDDKTVEIVRSLSSSTWNPQCKPVTDAISDLKKYYSASRWKILWSEFLDTYFSKPWVLISALAATALLLMTALQVFCLFYTCNENA